MNEHKKFRGFRAHSIVQKMALLAFFVLNSGCITMPRLRIKNAASLEKRPVIGCVETALSSFREIGFREFRATCVSQLHLSEGGLTHCVPTYQYDYRIPNPSRDEGFLASVLIEIREGKSSYENFFYSNDNLSENEKKIVIESLAKVDAHIKSQCGIDLAVKSSTIKR